MDPFLSTNSRIVEFQEYKVMTMQGGQLLLRDSIGLESLESFEVECVKCYCLILSIELIKGIFSLFAIIAERTFLMSSIF